MAKRRNRKNGWNGYTMAVVAICLIISFLYTKINGQRNLENNRAQNEYTNQDSIAMAAGTLPEYEGEAYVEVDHNLPAFSEFDRENLEPFEEYSPLDDLGRCGEAYANVCQEIMPIEERGSISSVHPSGWHKNMGWERCHLIGWQLAGEDANEENLITGTHYFNVTGMLPFEIQIADYVHETNHHVLYRVTPYFAGDELIARGVEMEAWSIEDEGRGICFDIYVFNVLPDGTIDYKTGVVGN